MSETWLCSGCFMNDPDEEVYETAKVLVDGKWYTNDYCEDCWENHRDELDV